MREQSVGATVSWPRLEESMANSSHTIRLNGPWQCELLKSGVGTESLTVKLPVDWSRFFCDRSRGSMVWTRSFGLPTNLGDRERVELVISNLCPDARVELNEVRLEPLVGVDANTRFELTNRLEARNRLAFKVRTPSSEGATTAGPFGQVYLEIFTDSSQSR